MTISSVLQCVAVCCSVLQCVAVCCSESHLPRNGLYLGHILKKNEKTQLFCRYFISAPASAIVAQPGTMTGSIGVVGGKLTCVFCIVESCVYIYMYVCSCVYLCVCV